MKTQHAPNWSQCLGIWEKANFHSVGKSHRFPYFVSMGHCVLHNSAFYCQARLRPRCFNYWLSVDNFPDFSSWGFMLGPRPHPPPEGSVSSGNSIPTALLLSTKECSFVIIPLSSGIYFIHLKCGSIAILIFCLTRGLFPCLWFMEKWRNDLC